MKQSFAMGRKVNLLEKCIILLGNADYAHEVDNYEFSDIILPVFWFSLATLSSMVQLSGWRTCFRATKLKNSTQNHTQNGVGKDMIANVKQEMLRLGFHHYSSEYQMPH